ncbi:MAG: hypothetical protein JXR60_03660 [Bacteroidales bacterium]|nr:hypothetical protein [Bacteroidales bacterium]
MKPFQILIFYILILITLLGIAFIIPQDGVRIADGFTFQFPTVEELLNSDNPRSKKTDSLIQAQLAVLSDTINEQSFEPVLRNDTLASLLDIPVKQKIIHIDTLKVKVEKISFSKASLSRLHQLFDRLQNPKSVIRILHYGDSQIEGDRITSFLRNRLQKKFGGTGVGLINPKPLVNTFAIDQTYTENWMRFPIFGAKDGEVNHKRYGILGAFCRYLPVVKDSTQTTNADSVYSGSLNLSESKIAYATDRPMRNLTIFYANGSEHVLNEIYTDGQMQFAKYLQTNTKFSKLKYRFNALPKSIDIKFSGKDSPDIYAISIDADRGVVVDNIPMRGSSGTFFNQMDVNLLSQFYHSLDIGMILLEFGGNVVPFIETEQGITNYEGWFESQIRTLRKIVPDVPIIVMGVADMSKKEKDKMITYPYVEPLRDAMKRAALNSGAAYWDMYEAMGGENSMPEWVDAEPKLATDDYTHFTTKGAQIMGNMFYNALMYEYQKYTEK